MEIRIDENVIQEALNDQATKGLANAFGNYGIRSAIQEVIANSVIPEIMATAVVDAASKIDTERLTQCVAEELTRAVIKGTQAIVRETMTTILLDIRKIPDYERDKREKARLEISTKLFG